MSYILDALRKAERERRLGGIPGIQLSSQAAGVGAGTRWPQWLALGLLVNAMLFAGGILLWQHRNLATDMQNPPDPASAGEVAASAETPASTESSAQPGQHSASSQRAEEGDTVGAEIPQGPLEAQSPPPPPAAAPKPQPLPPPPLLGELSQSYRNSVPVLTLTVHVYSESPAQRFVFINDRRYREGQQLKEGPKLESIQPRGVILSWKGKRFLLVGDW